MFKRMIKGVRKALDDTTEVSGSPEADKVLAGPRSRNARDSATILREATAAKKDGRIADAIDFLREAYAAIDQETGGEPFTYHKWDTFIRLPQYLQAAGRGDEAWREFEAQETE